MWALLTATRVPPAGGTLIERDIASDGTPGGAAVSLTIFRLYSLIGRGLDKILYRSFLDDPAALGPPGATYQPY